ncbi:hypothetical protein D3C78_1567790 [compost metagenome]
MLGVPRQASIEGAKGVEGTAQALLQSGPGLGVRRVLGQPGIETCLQGGRGGTGAQAHHPVDGLLADRVQALCFHVAISLR